MNFKFTANIQTYSSKPTKKEAAKISTDMHTVYVDSIKGFIEDTEQGIP
jgi:hypothetical protein